MFLSSADFLQNHFLFSKNISGIPSVSIILDPDQARHFVGPDLGQTVCKSHQQTTPFGKVCHNSRVESWLGCM